MKTILAALLAWGVFPCLSATCLGQTADAKLNDFYLRYLDKVFARRPVEATHLGDHRFDDRLDDLSAAARAGWVELDRQTLAELPRQIDSDALSPAGKVDYEILKHHLARSLWAEANLHPFADDPRVYNGYINDGVYLLLAQSSLPKEKNIANAIARMGQIPKIVAAAKKTLHNPPRAFAETALRQNDGAIDFYERGIFELAGETPQREALQKAVRSVVACLKEYRQFLESELLPRAAGEWRLGKEKFAQKLDFDLNAGISADEVLSQAESEFARVQRDMYVVARQLWSRYFPGKTLPPDDAAGRHATIAEVLGKIGQEHGKPEDLIRDARATVARIKKFIAENDILRLPEPDRCEVVEMPEFKRGNSTAYMQSAPPLDPETACFYAVSPPPKDWDEAKVRSFLEEYNSHMLQILTIHEAYPGHYVQHAYGVRNPSPIRKVLGSGTYVEGWAVYTEQTMLDQGYGGGDLPLRLTQLKFYLRAVTNAILDHKMHCGDMTDEEAMRLLAVDAYQSEGEARLKVIRSKQSPCQLSTYFVGRMAMYRMRQQIQRELGDKFNLGRYHEAVLAESAVPVKYLPTLVKRRLEK
ncbi:MAG: DUF885 domain-containing protein [Pirellulales bacterium]|nr:DUF885 domain-containing protein [Pirellulales bacterium]